MKLITAVFKPSRLDAVIEAISEAGATGLTVTEVRGYGRQQGKTEVYRGAEYEVRLLPKVKVELACADDDAERLIEAITQSANTSSMTLK
jgi:nitrogen regulatory protein P-II 2